MEETLTETVTAPEITTGGIFEQAGEVMTGFIDMTGDFFISLWNNPMGKIVIGVSLVGGAIGLCYKLFLRKKHV